MNLEGPWHHGWIHVAGRWRAVCCARDQHDAQMELARQCQLWRVPETHACLTLGAPPDFSPDGAEGG
jgi:hypothetical protein